MQISLEGKPLMNHHYRTVQTYLEGIPSVEP